MLPSQHQEILISELTALYLKDFEKLISKIYDSKWKLNFLNENSFSIINNENLSEIVIDFDADAHITIESNDLFEWNRITLDYEPDIEILKAIIKLIENKDVVQEVIENFLRTLRPIVESYNILKNADR